MEVLDVVSCEPSVPCFSLSQEWLSPAGRLVLHVALVREDSLELHDNFNKN